MDGKATTKALHHDIATLKDKHEYLESFWAGGWQLRRVGGRVSLRKDQESTWPQHS